MLCMACTHRPPSTQPSKPSDLAVRLLSLLAYQENDGSHILLPPGGRNTERIVEAAHTLHLLGRLDEARLRQTAEELRLSWSPSLRAYQTNDGPVAYGDDDSGRQLYRYDLLSLNVRVEEFLRGTGELPAVQDLPRPDLRGLVDQLRDDAGLAGRIMRTRAARLIGAPGGAESPGRCTQMAADIRAGRIDQAGDAALVLPAVTDCASELRPLRDDISVLESQLADRIERDQTSSYDDIIALNRLKTLAEATGRTGISAVSTRVAVSLLRGLDDSAREYGPVTEPWTVAVLAGMLGDQPPPRLDHLVRRIEALLDFGGSLATQASADWYSKAIMAHLMVLSGALSPQRAADLFGHPSRDRADLGTPAWLYAFIGLRGGATAGLKLPGDAVAPDAGLLPRALYAADSGSCADAPDWASFASTSPLSQIPDLAPDKQLAYLLALDLSVSCAADLTDLRSAVVDRIELPGHAPDPTAPGSLTRYLATAEAVCLARGAVTLEPAVESALETYRQALSTGPVTQHFDFLDLYAALRLLALHESRNCDGAWWHGLDQGSAIHP
ncbi:hypothetical protein [Micromonospora sp. WMMD1082]|uniref:hypothetical protein n=1 Tax=Micromonospora sp. WMMD1082 TaxID=3016104 RepID=UPI002415E837|nr:hypothetical protein [Micromonospora sp. WMMD1082]MDG4797865.1 hypothetical protein [Micromonospora sp. WMMD1082]